MLERCDDTFCRGSIMRFKRRRSRFDIARERGVQKLFVLGRRIASQPWQGGASKHSQYAMSFGLIEQLACHFELPA